MYVKHKHHHHHHQHQHQLRSHAHQRQRQLRSHAHQHQRQLHPMLIRLITCKKKKTQCSQSMTHLVLNSLPTLDSN